MPRKRVEPRTEIVQITPELAAEWLQKNTHNRPLRDRDVEKLKDAILRGEWKLIGNPIQWDYNGTLIDGQHRLWAICFAERTVPAVVAWDLEPEAQYVIDTGIKRRLSDHLKLMGRPSATALAAAINFKWKEDRGLVRTSRTPTIPEALALFAKNPQLEDGVRVGNRWSRKLRGSTMAVSALFHEFSNVDSDAAASFFDSIINGVNLSPGMPEYAVRRMAEGANQGTVMFAALIIKAWNAYMQGEVVDRLVWRPVGRSAEDFPRIWGKTYEDFSQDDDQ